MSMTDSERRKRVRTGVIVAAILVSLFLLSISPACTHDRDNLPGGCYMVYDPNDDREHIRCPGDPLY